MTTSVNVHGISAVSATTSPTEEGNRSAWVTIYATDANSGTDLLEITLFTNGNQALAERIANAINNAMPKLELVSCSES